jgi:predicted Zn-ribbon and HTH transcriptional regulator
MKSTLACIICNRTLGGRQRRFCSLRCKNADTNNRHQNYAAQRTRGLRRKLELLEQQGARCRRCGYDGNLAALSWHHVEPRRKSFSLDMRALSNRSEAEILREASKCVVLCLNCHAETHFPGYALPLPPPKGSKTVRKAAA